MYGVQINLAKAALGKPGLPEVANRPIVGIYYPDQCCGDNDTGSEIPLEICFLKDLGNLVEATAYLLEHDRDIVNSDDRHQVNALVGFLCKSPPYQLEFSVLEAF